MSFEEVADKYADRNDRLLIHMTRAMFIAEIETAIRNAAVANAVRRDPSAWVCQGPDECVLTQDPDIVRGFMDKTVAWTVTPLYMASRAP